MDLYLHTRDTDFDALYHNGMTNFKKLVWEILTKSIESCIAMIEEFKPDVIVGFSLGGEVAMAAASRSFKGSVVSICSSTTWDRHYATGIPTAIGLKGYTTYNPIDHVSQYNNMNLTLICGSRDRVVSKDSIYDFQRRVGENVITLDVDHDAMNPLVVDAVLKILNHRG